MTSGGCARIALDDLTDYAAGDLAPVDAAAIEEHLFSCADCGARAAEFDSLIAALSQAIRSAEFDGFVTDAVLNRLARDGVRMRAFSLSPGAVVPCAVWDGDEVMALRLSGDFDPASDLTLSQRIAGTEVSRATGRIAAGAREIIYILSAAWVRQVPVVEVDVIVTAQQDGEETVKASYKLLHGGQLHR